MLNEEAIKKYLDGVVEAFKADAQTKGQKIPEGFRVETDQDGGRLWGADYFKYLVLGRGPGKAPPPEKMLEFLKKNPDILAQARQTFKNISEASLGFLIGRKIAKKGTSIFEGKKPGIDFIGSMEMGMPELLKTIARNEAVNILTNMQSAIKVLLLFVCLSCSGPYVVYPTKTCYICTTSTVVKGETSYIDQRKVEVCDTESAIKNLELVSLIDNGLVYVSVKCEKKWR